MAGRYRFAGRPGRTGAYPTGAGVRPAYRRVCRPPQPRARTLSPRLNAGGKQTYMQKSQPSPKILQDPKEGGILVAPAGGAAEAHFRCPNTGNPNVAFFSLRIEGLPDPSWAQSG